MKLLQTFKLLYLLVVRMWGTSLPSQWRHNKGDGVSNNRRLDCLPSSLFRRRSKKTSLVFVRETTGDQWIPLTKGQ